MKVKKTYIKWKISLNFWIKYKFICNFCVTSFSSKILRKNKAQHTRFPGNFNCFLFFICKRLYTLKSHHLMTIFCSEFVEVFYLNSTSIQELHEIFVVGKLIFLISFQFFERSMQIQCKFYFSLYVVLRQCDFKICGNLIRYVLENLARF
jgi:hypothetical protein